MRMKKEYLEPFVEAALEVSQSFFGGKAKIIHEERQKDLKMNKDIIVALAVVKQLKGLALFGLDKEDAIVMAKRAFLKMGGAESEFDPNNKEHIDSALMEFGNVVMGKATTLYAQRNFKCDISVPKIIKPDQLGVYPYECVKLELENETIMELKLHLEQR